MVDFVCIFAALLFFSSNLLSIIAQVLRGKHENTNFESMKGLDPDYLASRWTDADQTSSRLFLASGILKTFAWFVFLVPILQMVWILSRHGQRKLGVHAMIASLALGGTLSELISRLMVIGAYSAAHWIASDFNLDSWLEDGTNDGTGWRVLELVYIVVEGEFCPVFWQILVIQNMLLTCYSLYIRIDSLG